MKKGQKNPANKLNQNRSPVSAPILITEQTNEKSEVTMEGLGIGNKKLQLQKEREAREEEERIRALQERAKEMKNNASKKKGNKKLSSRAQKPEPKAEIPREEIVQKPETQIKRNSSGIWNIVENVKNDESQVKHTSDYSQPDNLEADNSYQESAPRRNSVKLVRNISNEQYFDNKHENTSWGKREDSFQNPEIWDDSEIENSGFNSKLNATTISNFEFNESEPEQKTEAYGHRSQNKGQNISHKYSRPDYYKNEPSYRDNYKSANRNFSFSRQNYGNFSRNEGRDDKDYQYFLESSKHKPEINHGKLTEIRGDLFTASEDFSLAHCVAEDMSMGAGIAKTFRKEFGEVGKLLSQNQQTGGLAVLEKKTRFIYYLVTKYQSRGKPTYYTLWQSLQKLKKHIQENNVTKLALPQIGCGLDRLEWHVVRQMLEHIFQDVEIKINYYVYDESVDETTPKKVMKKCVVVHEIMNLVDIAGGTGLLYFGTADGCETEEIKCLTSKFNLQEYKGRYNVTDIVRSTPSNDYYIYGLIIKKCIDDEINFFDIEKTIRNLRKILEKDHTNYIGLQAFIDKKDNLLMDRIIALMQYIFLEIEIWVCWPENLRDKCPQQKKTFF